MNPVRVGRLGRVDIAKQAGIRPPREREGDALPPTWAAVMEKLVAARAYAASHPDWDLAEA